MDDTNPRLATRLAFLTAGFTMACWAPLVPFAKARIGADDRLLGLLLLGLGIGSLIAMPLTGWLSAQSGSKPMIIGGGLGMCVLLPLLATADSALVLAVALVGFGASLGTLDVAMNIHAVEVERQAGRHLMSGFHAMFSLGGILGAGAMTLLLSLGVTPLAASLGAAALGLVAIGIASPRFLPARGTPTPLVAPHGAVMLLAGLCAISFLVEGAMLDWGALLVIGKRLVDAAHGGLGYMLFSIAMTIGRLTGDRLVARLGDGRVLLWGGLTTIAGFALLLTAPVAALAMAGFLLIGLGAANIVPVLFRQAGNQTVMPVGLAVAAITTTAYAGVLAGPAAVGFVSRAFSLPTAFWLLAALWSLIPLCARWITTPPADRSAARAPRRA
ncbi:MAG TPA: MFS transporter [Opitutaceae bacterium]|nr:MFS transporter [Opitutaceae bacterium]